MIFFFLSKRRAEETLLYPKYIKHKIKYSTKNWGDINLTQLTYL
jgi:hypothetical protein